MIDRRDQMCSIKNEIKKFDDNKLSVFALNAYIFYYICKYDKLLNVTKGANLVL